MDICRMTANQLARALRRRKLSAGEALQAVIARCEAVNPAINAIALPLFERARPILQTAPEDSPGQTQLTALQGELDVSRVSFASDAGSLPVSSLPPMSIAVSNVRSPMAGGIVPVSARYRHSSTAGSLGRV